MTPPPPLRFLGLVVGGWVCVRAALLAPGWPDDVDRDPIPPARLAARKALPRFDAAPAPAALATPSTSAPAMEGAEVAAPPALADSMIVPFLATVNAAPAVMALVPAHEMPPRAKTALPPAPPFATGALPSWLPGPRVARWSGSAWAFVRQGGASALAAGGTLGASQAGARLAYRLNGEAARPLSILARIYSPTETARAAEAALGVEWQPLAGVPVRLLAERRQGVTAAGRSAFALAAYGGVSGKPAGPLALDAYAQAGVVGFRFRDVFVDGSASLGLSLAEGARIAGAAWAGAQPGVWRVDIGPQLSLRLPGPARNVRLIADWRVRVAGDAAPGSGPALTLATDF